MSKAAAAAVCELQKKASDTAVATQQRGTTFVLCFLSMEVTVYHVTKNAYVIDAHQMTLAKHFCSVG
jgi:hypothetical protein